MTILLALFGGMALSSEGGFAPLPIPPPRADGAGGARARKVQAPAP
jgi:hypothetical protein